MNNYTPTSTNQQYSYAQNSTSYVRINSARKTETQTTQKNETPSSTTRYIRDDTRPSSSLSRNILTEPRNIRGDSRNEPRFTADGRRIISINRVPVGDNRVEHTTKPSFVKKLNVDEIPRVVPVENVVKVQEVKAHEGASRRVVSNSNYRTIPASNIRSETNIVSTHNRPPIPQATSSTSNIIKATENAEKLMSRIDQKLENGAPRNHQNPLLH